MTERAPPALAASITRAVDFLADNQLENGEFRAYRSSDELMRDDCQPDSTVFVTALIGHALNDVRSPIAQAMIEQGVSFLLREMEAPCTWRFWTRSKPGHEMIPPDLDDTCCAAYVLKQRGHHLPRLTGLVLANRDVHGLFFTWIIPRWRLVASRAYWEATLPQVLHLGRLRAFWKATASEQNDVDCVVNANVLLYLGERPETLPVIQNLRRVVREGRAGTCDKWYVRPLSLYYAISRASYRGVSGLASLRNDVVERVEASVHESGGFASAVDAALTVSTLLNYGHSSSVTTGGVSYLLDTQDALGAWPARPVWWGGPRMTYGWGSAELTTALCVEALSRYERVASAR